jgi:hypothetical protein
MLKRECPDFEDVRNAAAEKEAKRIQKFFEAGGKKDEEA